MYLAAAGASPSAYSPQEFGICESPQLQWRAVITGVEESEKSRGSQGKFSDEVIGVTQVGNKTSFIAELLTIPGSSGTE